MAFKEKFLEVAKSAATEPFTKLDEGIKSSNEPSDRKPNAKNEKRVSDAIRRDGFQG